jgi:hypothetical protein
MAVKSISFEPGFIVVHTEDGPPRKYSAARFLQAADIPDLTINSLTLLTQLAQVVLVLVQDMMNRNLLDEDLFAGYDLQYVFETLIDTMNAEAS